MNHNKRNTSRRPMEVDEKHFDNEWDRIFGKNSKEDKKEKIGDELVLTERKA